MKGFEFSPGPRRSKVEEVPDATPDDFADSPELYQALRRLPADLQNMHATRMSDMDDAEAHAYILNILERREEATRESEISDAETQERFAGLEDMIWRDLESHVLTDTDNFLGAGMTARIKRYELPAEEGRAPQSIAVKYLLTPTEKTLSVSGEHDLIREVERVRAIESAEQKYAKGVSVIRVPHPYFYYKHRKTQCYGMELIDGANLEEGISGSMDSELREDLRTALSGISREALYAEVNEFLDAMHTVCLHGDIKPANLMVSRDGHFYVIDFGQSVLATDIDEKSCDAFEVLKEDEKVNMRTALTHFLNALEREED